MRYLLLAAALAVPLAGCVDSSQSRYNYNEVGKATVVEFGEVVAARPIDISGKNTGTGAVVGGTTGGLIGTQVGSGNGGIAGVVGGVILGAAAGAVAEQMMSNRQGIEYTIVLSNGKTVVIPQEKRENDRLFSAGERVMVQASGSYQRVLATDHLPAEVNRPKGIAVKD